MGHGELTAKLFGVAWLGQGELTAKLFVAAWLGHGELAAKLFGVARLGHGELTGKLVRSCIQSTSCEVVLAEDARYPENSAIYHFQSK